MWYTDDGCHQMHSKTSTMIDPKPYLEYLDKEMTIMGLLSAFSVALASFASEKIVTAESGFLREVWMHGQDHVIGGAATAVLAAFLFYLQRSHLAWYYGQIALACRRTSTSDSVENWLTLADGWDTWIRYQTGFIMLTVSFGSYAFAVAKALSPSLHVTARVWSLWLPFLLILMIVIVRWYVLSKFPQEDRPFSASWQLLRKLLNRAANRTAG
jgi:hypothetical protein